MGVGTVHVRRRRDSDRRPLGDTRQASTLRPSLDGRLQTCRHACCPISGRQFKQVIGTTCSHWPESSDACRARDAKVKAGPQDTYFLAADAADVWLQYNETTDGAGDAAVFGYRPRWETRSRRRAGQDIHARHLVGGDAIVVRVASEAARQNRTVLLVGSSAVVGLNSGWCLGTRPASTRFTPLSCWPRRAT